MCIRLFLVCTHPLLIGMPLLHLLMYVILSVSSDQTCRLFAPIGHGPHSVEPSTKNSHYSTWRELSRPQIHGYDIHSVALSPSMHEGKVAMQHRLYSGPSSYPSHSHISFRMTCLRQNL